MEPSQQPLGALSLKEVTETLAGRAALDPLGQGYTALFWSLQDRSGQRKAGGEVP